MPAATAPAPVPTPSGWRRSTPPRRRRRGGPARVGRRAPRRRGPRRAAGRARLRLHGQGLPRLAVDGHRRPRAPRARVATVCEVDLVAGTEALLPPQWLPWSAVRPATSVPATCCRRSSTTSASRPVSRPPARRTSTRSRSGSSVSAAAGAVPDRPRGGRDPLGRGRLRPHVPHRPGRRGAVPQLRLPAAHARRDAPGLRRLHQRVGPRRRPRRQPPVRLRRPLRDRRRPHPRVPPHPGPRRAAPRHRPAWPPSRAAPRRGSCDGRGQ